MEEQKICYSPKPFSGFTNGLFTSEIFDSGKTETLWDRLKLEICPVVKNSSKIKTKSRVYISDNKELIINNKQHISKDKIITSEFTDILLYGSSINGRYLHFEVELFEGEAVFSGYELTFPKQSFTEYLPAIYQENELLERFLAVYQNQYLDAEREIMNFHRRLNAQETDMLNWLAGLIGGEMFLRLSEINLRKLLGVTTLLYKIKGTKNCVKLLIYALTGEIPMIIDCAGELTESEQVRFCLQNIMFVTWNGMRGTQNMLFDEQSGHFYLMLNSRPDIDLDLLNYLIKQFIPVNAYYTTVFLDENRTMGGFCFLGVNSIISDKKQLVVGASKLGEDLRL